MKQEERNKKYEFRKFVDTVRRFAKGENPNSLNEIFSITFRHYDDLGIIYPEELIEDIKKITQVMSDTDCLKWLSYLTKKGELSEDISRLSNPRLRELEENRDYREQKIKEFLQRYRYIRRIVPISERLEISDERLEELSKRIKPVVRLDGKLYYIREVNLRETAFTWSPKLKEEAKGLEELIRIRTYHTYGYPGFFKPSIAEVLSQIPKRHLLHTSAFEIPVHVTDSEPKLCGEYHIARTILYKKSEK